MHISFQPKRNANSFSETVDSDQKQTTHMIHLQYNFENIKFLSKYTKCNKSY